jgi:hypothetical protein
MNIIVLDIMKCKLQIVIFLVFCFSYSFSQTKTEKETRIKFDEFPTIAQLYFKNLSNEFKRVKFYKESDGDKISYEAKFKYKKQHFSVEFFASGVLEDIEILINKKNIPSKALGAIDRYFDTNFDKTRYIKIQKQFVNNNQKKDFDFIKHVIEHSNDSYNYFEIIAEIKSNGKDLLKEFTFKSSGVFVKSRIVTSASYEHALY